MAQRDPRAGIDDYIARLWCVINSYPLSRRPVWIAANLSMDTVKAGLPGTPVDGTSNQHAGSEAMEGHRRIVVGGDGSDRSEIALKLNRPGSDGGSDSPKG